MEYTVLIVEDNQIALESLRRTIPWEELGCVWWVRRITAVRAVNGSSSFARTSFWRISTCRKWTA